MYHKNLSMAIGSIAWGYLFFYLDINLGPLDILPDWVCFVLIVSSLPLLAKVVPSAQLLRPLGTLLGAYYGINWVLTIFRCPIQWYLITTLMGALLLYVNFQLLTNLAEAVRLGGYPQERKILRLRTGQAVLTTAAALPIQWETYKIASILLVGAHLMVVVWICVVLFGLRKKIELEAQATEE